MASRLDRQMEARVRPSAAFAAGIMNPEVAPCMTGRAHVATAHTAALSTDVLRAYDAYSKEVHEAATGVWFLRFRGVVGTWEAFKYRVQYLKM